MNRRKLKPIENHSAAAWSNVGRTKAVSNVPVSDEFQSINAKEYADENEK